MRRCSVRPNSVRRGTAAAELAILLPLLAFMFVVGDREVQSRTLAIRGRSGANLGSMTIAGALDLLRADLKPAGQQQTLTQ